MEVEPRDLDDGTAVRGRAPRLAGDAPPGAGRRAASAGEGSRGTFSEGSDADGRRGGAVDGRATGIGRAPAASASRTSAVRARSVTSARRDASSARNARSSMVSPAASRLSAFQSTLRRITDAVSRDALEEASGEDAWAGAGEGEESRQTRCVFVARAEFSATPREGSRRRTRGSPLTNTLSFPFPTSASMPNDSLLARSGSRRRSSAMSATSVVGRAETNERCGPTLRAGQGTKKILEDGWRNRVRFFFLLLSDPSTRGGVEGPASAADADVSRRRVRAIAWTRGYREGARQRRRRTRSGRDV